MHRLYQPVLEILEASSRDIVLPYYQNLQSHEVDEKTPGDLVTVADKLSEEFISEALTALTPDAKLVGEEAFAADPAVMDQIAEGQVWIVDPLTGRICHAVKNGGAFMNGAPIAVPEDHPDRPVAALATGFMTVEQQERLLDDAEPFYQIVDIPRCAAEQYPRLVLGTNHISVFHRTLPWDHAAGILFLNEAGGKCARWDGSSYRPADRKKGLLGASSPKLWDEAAERLGDIFRI